MEIKKTDRGFELVEFNDANGERCTLQQSSATMGGSAGADFIWLGVHEPRIQIMKSTAVELGIKVDGEVSGWMDYPLPPGVEAFSRMHLCRDHVMQLIPLLQRWVESGSFAIERSPTNANELFDLKREVAAFRGARDACKLLSFDWKQYDGLVKKTQAKIDKLLGEKGGE